MKNLLYVIALLLIIAWALGSFVMAVGGVLIHLLLLIAVAMILLNFFRGKRL